VDLGRWLGEEYRIPVGEAGIDSEDAPPSPGEGRKPT
jgi:endogenous inhibitor of DNA gyrase (YacG/DUF329 family)